MRTFPILRHLRSVPPSLLKASPKGEGVHPSQSGTLRWIENPDYRRRIHRQLNKGEAFHALRRFLFFAHQGKVQRRQADQQTNQVLCLNLVTNAIVTWNTVYINAAIERLRAEGRIGRDIDLGHLSPAPSTGTSIPTVSTDSRSRVERQVSDR